MAPRANWKGFLRLSLVTCPVALYPATSDSEKVSFNQINRNTGHRIKYARVTMQNQLNEIPTGHKRVPWNKGKVTGAKPPLRPKDVWSIRTRLQIEGRARDLAMFNLDRQ